MEKIIFKIEVKKHLIVSFGIFLVYLNCTKDEISQAGVPYLNQVGAKKAWAGQKTRVHILAGRTPAFPMISLNVMRLSG